MQPLPALLLFAFATSALAQDTPPPSLLINPTQVINTLADPHPLGINVNFFNDNDHFLHAPRPLSAALREMGVHYLRYPGGDKSDYYLFSVPPYDHAIATPSQTGPGTNETRAYFFNANRTAYNREVLNFDDFMTLCRDAGCQPIIVCAIDTYVQTKARLPGAIRVSTRQDFLRNAVEWVRYANIKHHYAIKYWMLGNESWVAYYKTAAGVPYSYPPEMYGPDLVDFSAAMKAVDPTISVVANGIDWSIPRFLPTAARSIDAICTSNYPIRPADPIASYADWTNKTYKHGDLAWPVEDALKAIDDSPIPPAIKQRLVEITPEFGPYDFSNNKPPNKFGTRMDLAHALLNFDLIGQLLSIHRNIISLFWNTRWKETPGPSDALYPDNTLTPLGQGLALWANYLNPQLIKTTPPPGLITYASYNPQTRQIYVDIINQLAAPKTVTLTTPTNFPIQSLTKVADMSAPTPDSPRTTYHLNQSTPIPTQDITLPPYSATVYSLILR
jgi:hypothetical protein